jgi:hypothetical protein
MDGVWMLRWLVSGVVLAFWLPATMSAQTPPTRVFGTVLVDGQPAPAGTSVQAFIGERQCGDGQVRRISDEIPLGYVVDVLSATQTTGCGADGDRITFKVGGRQAGESTEFRTGTFVRLNLTVSGQVETPTPGPTPPPFGSPTTPAGGMASPGSGATTVQPSPAAGGTATATGSPSLGPTATTPSPDANGNDDGSGATTAALIVVGVAVAAAAGSAGYYLYRRRGA